MTRPPTDPITPPAAWAPPQGALGDRLKAWVRGPARKYLAIFGWLLLLTLIEVGATFFSMPKKTLAAFLIGTALVKALLVALYFMHLRHEVRLILAIVVLPMLIAVLFFFGLFPDIVVGPRAAP